MRGPKLNEGATVIGERHGTKATAKYVRSSAYKARVVLDLVRGLPVHQADEVLQFTDRSIARDIRKVLASAVANATDVDSGAYIADADELFVLACFADEGPTLRRFRPRARGRATRIRKRTCHITIVVARMSEQRLEIVRARAEGRGGSSQSANRRARVERSRQRAEAARTAVDQVDAAEGDEDAIDELDDETADDIVGTADTDVEGFAGVEDAEPDDIEVEEVTVDADEVDAAEAEADAADDAADAASGEFAAGEHAGSVLPDEDGNGPDTHPIKGNADSMLYHTPDSRYYAVTKAEVWFDTEENAEAAGFAKPGTQANEESDEG
jgi:large subunit ribosomal protein L22